MTDTPVYAGGRYAAGGEIGLLVNHGQPFPLARTSFTLTVALHCRIIEAADVRAPWRLSTSAYYYALAAKTGEELLAFHWHPHVGPTYPHVHVGAGVHGLLPGLHKKHIPTGRVALEEVLRFAFTELGAKARRENWKGIFARTQEGFNRGRSW